jgi:hypothetical protein
MARGQRTRQNTDSLPASHRRNNGGASQGKRVAKRVSARSRVYASSRQRTTLKPYTPEKYSQDECVWFSSTQSWDDGQSRLLEGIKKLEFSSDFYVTEYDLLTPVVRHTDNVQCPSYLHHIHGPFPMPFIARFSSGRCRDRQGQRNKPRCCHTICGGLPEYCSHKSRRRHQPHRRVSPRDIDQLP